MNKYLEQLSGWVESLNNREKILVLSAVTVLLFVIWDMFFLAPMLEQKKQLNSQLIQVKTQAESLNEQLAQIRQQQQNDSNSMLNRQRDELRKSIEQTEERIRERLDGRVEAAEMTNFLRDLLSENDQLSLLKLNNLIATPILAEETVAGQATGDGAVSNTIPSVVKVNTGVYRHGMVLQFEGSYLDVLNYLTAVEQMPWVIYWNSIQLETEEYPTIKVSLEVHTFSLKGSWLGV